MPQIFFLNSPVSLRHCKCLFVSILVVCTLTVLVAFKFRPELVKTPSHPRALNSIGQDLSSEDALSNKNQAEQNKASPGVQFLPRTESEPANQPDEESLIRGQRTPLVQNLDQVVNGEPIFYQNNLKVPDIHRGNWLPTLFHCSL